MSTYSAKNKNWHEEISSPFDIYCFRIPYFKFPVFIGMSHLGLLFVHLMGYRFYRPVIVNIDTHRDLEILNSVDDSEETSSVSFGGESKVILKDSGNNLFKVWEGNFFTYLAWEDFIRRYYFVRARKEDVTFKDAVWCSVRQIDMVTRKTKNVHFDFFAYKPSEGAVKFPLKVGERKISYSDVFWGEFLESNLEREYDKVVVSIDLDFLNNFSFLETRGLLDKMSQFIVRNRESILYVYIALEPDYVSFPRWRLVPFANCLLSGIISFSHGDKSVEGYEESRKVSPVRVYMVKAPYLPYGRSLLYLCDGVYSPVAWNVSEEFEKHKLAQILAEKDVVKPGMKVLDLGCGSGYLSLIAAARGAKVNAVDVQMRAVVNTMINVNEFGLRDRVSVFENDGLKGLGEYDLILWNMPVPVEENVDESDLNIVMPYKKAEEIIRSLEKHLKLGGMALIRLYYEQKVEKLLKEHNLTYKVLCEQRIINSNQAPLHNMVVCLKKDSRAASSLSNRNVIMLRGVKVRYSG